MTEIPSAKEELIEWCREILGSRKQPPLELQLESEGWTWGSNHETTDDKENYHWVDTREEIQERQEQIHSEVRLERAYDVEGELLPKEFVAVYYKN